MLITFSTPAYPKITMFGDPAALQKLRAGVQAQAASEPETAENDDPAAEPRVGLATRAFPLIELLEAAAAAEKEVMWDQ
jgi:hypothetical protein